MPKPITQPTAAQSPGALLKAETAVELDALLSAILDRAFKRGL
jgi:hypothetical protein